MAYLPRSPRDCRGSRECLSTSAIVQEKAKLRRVMAACLEAIKACQEQRESAADVVGKLGVALKGIRGGKK